MDYTKTACLLLITAALIGMVSGAQLLTKMELEINSLSGISSVDNSDGTSVQVTILNSTGGIVVQRYAAEGVYLPGMAITMQGEKFNLSYSTQYTYRLTTPQGTFNYNFTTPEEPASGGGAELHSGQQTCWDTSGTPRSCTGTGEDAELDGTAKSFTDNGDGTVTDDHTGIMW
jgi:hypothetical protein